MAACHALQAAVGSRGPLPSAKNHLIFRFRASAYLLASAGHFPRSRRLRLVVRLQLRGICLLPACLPAASLRVL